VKAIPIGMALLAALSLASACTHDIGDACTTNVDCDPNGTRACDLSQPGGYCTIQGCSETSCPSGSACIRVFPAAFLTTPCNPLCEDLQSCACPPVPDGGVSPCTPSMLPPNCQNCPNGPTNDCTADELCVETSSEMDGMQTGLCARRELEQRYCAKNCGNDGDCRGGYQCRTSSTIEGGLALGATPGVVTKYCAPNLSAPAFQDAGSAPDSSQ
jgi:hypothetical protein